MVNCGVLGCGNRANRDREFSFFRLPTVRLTQGEQTHELSTERRRLWLLNIGRPDMKQSSYQYFRVCSLHFVNGKPSALYDKSNPDWAPTLHLDHDKVKLSTANANSSRHERTVDYRRQRKSNEVAQSLLALQDVTVKTEPTEVKATKVSRKMPKRILTPKEREVNRLRAKHWRETQKWKSGFEFFKAECLKQKFKRAMIKPMSALQRTVYNAKTARNMRHMRARRHATSKVSENVSTEDTREMISCWPPPSPEASTETREPEVKVEQACNDTLNTQIDCARSATPPVTEVLITPLLTTTDSIRFPKLEPEETEVGADIMLARWWKTQLRCLVDPASLVQPGVNAHTRLMQISRMPEAQAFMWKEVCRLESYLDTYGTKDLATVHHALGTLYERLGDGTKAYHHLHIALSQHQPDSDMSWVLERILRQLKVAAAQVFAMFRINKELPRCLRPPRQVARRAAETLTYQDFLVTYAMTHTPVVITGLNDVITKTPWTLNHIRQVAGTCRMRPRCLVEDSAEWARLEPGPEMTVCNLLSRVQYPTDADMQNPHCLFDWSLPLYCPQLAEQVTIPKYFAGDLLQRTSEGSLYRDSWPSLFVAPSGAVSELHVDTFGSNFWMALFMGKKRWVFFQPEDASLLYPRYWQSLDPIFDVDLNNPDVDQHPLLTLAQPQEVILEEGEVLFVPAGCPHRVENLTDTVAISSNFVDVSNLAGVRAELLAQSLMDPRATALLSQLQATGFNTAPNLQQGHLTFKQFKTQGRS